MKGMKPIRSMRPLLLLWLLSLLMVLPSCAFLSKEGRVSQEGKESRESQDKGLNQNQNQNQNQNHTNPSGDSSASLSAFLSTSSTSKDRAASYKAVVRKHEEKMRRITLKSGGRLQLPHGSGFQGRYSSHGGHGSHSGPRGSRPHGTKRGDSDKRGDKRRPSSVNLVGPDGDVILFYKEKSQQGEDKIVIQECEVGPAIDKVSDCQRPHGAFIRKVPVSDFKRRLQSVLRVNKLPTLGPKEARQVKAYREGIEGMEAPSHDLVRQRDEAQEKVSGIEKFIEAYGEENAGSLIKKLATLRKNLEELDSKIDSKQEFADAVSALNGVIESLVDEVIGSPRVNTRLYSKDKTGIEYSVLRAYVRLALSQYGFVPVSAGSFIMGSPKTEKVRGSDETPHKVTISKPFEIGTTEVTQWQWFVVMGTNPSKFQEKEHCPESYMEQDGVSMCADHPVERVSWEDVQEFINEYNRRARESHGDKYEYRLPTEAEWEFAARGGAKAGTKTAYSFGDNPSELKNYGWHQGNSGSGNQSRQSRSVGLLSSNPLGLYDVHGNVWEWVEDWYEREYPEGPVTDPRGPRSGSYRIAWWRLERQRSLPALFRSYQRSA